MKLEEAYKILNIPQSSSPEEAKKKYRELAKQNSVYLEGFKSISNTETHRIHPSYLQHVTASGRLSCVRPSLHTTPRDNKIRNMIIPIGLRQ